MISSVKVEYNLRNKNNFFILYVKITSKIKNLDSTFFAFYYKFMKILFLERNLIFLLLYFKRIYYLDLLYRKFNCELKPSIT